MSKYLKDLDLQLVNEVKAYANQIGFSEYGIEIETVCIINKKNAPYGEVLRSNEILKLFSNKDNLIIIALNEDIMLQFDEETRRMLIENLFEQIMFEEKEDGELKISIKKPEIAVGLGTYHKYKDKIIEKLELVILTKQQMIEQENLKKAIKKECKKNWTKFVE